MALPEQGNEHGTAGLVQINDALLVTLTNDAHGAKLGIQIRQTDADQLGYTHAAVEKQREHGVVAYAVFGFRVVLYAFQKADAFF